MQATMAAWTPPVPKDERNYPLNCWWVAAFSDEVGQGLLGRWLLDTPVLLYRKGDGTAVAMEDRCPHRAAPLSLGERRGDNVECGYHGFTFSPKGKCVRVPSIDGEPPEFTVRSYPVIEQAPFVWIYLGDPAAIDNVEPPHALDWFEDEDFATEIGRLDVAANYMLLKENVLDLTHFGYVHAASFEITDWVGPPKVTRHGEHIGYSQHFVNSPLPEIFATPLGLETATPFDRHNYGYFVTPALQIAGVDFSDPKQPDANEPFGRFRVSHATTPVDKENMLYFWVIARDYGTSAEEMKAFKEITEVGFAEDEEMIEAVQINMSRDQRYSPKEEVSVLADAPHLQARRTLKKWMDLETG